VRAHVKEGAMLKSAATDHQVASYLPAPCRSSRIISGGRCLTRNV
jgi:hypothetical protein